MAGQKQSLGRWGEDRAAEYLESKGYEILGRNLRTDYGEIDLLARQEMVIVFVEVKTRNTNHYGHPEESITPAKQQHMADAAESYLQNHPELNADWRVDVVSILRRRNQPAEILHIENALAE
ncbi:MAG TPA: YraN family protein [Anaerolineales bacterium]|jgi:putative endonuclease|nr:YraN family protein [Anaerolineales bacterium]